MIKKLFLLFITLGCFITIAPANSSNGMPFTSHDANQGASAAGAPTSSGNYIDASATGASIVTLENGSKGITMVVQLTDVQDLTASCKVCIKVTAVAANTDGVVSDLDGQTATKDGDNTWKIGGLVPSGTLCVVYRIWVYCCEETTSPPCTGCTLLNNTHPLLLIATKW